jgi:hypothetical protein
MIVPCNPWKGWTHPFEQAQSGTSAWYAMAATKLLPNLARGLNVNWDEAIRYAGLTSYEVSGD